MIVEPRRGLGTAGSSRTQLVAGTQTREASIFSVFKQVLVRKVFLFFPEFDCPAVVQLSFMVLSKTSLQLLLCDHIWKQLFCPTINLSSFLFSGKNVINRTTDFHTRLWFKSQLCQQLCLPRLIYSLTSANRRGNDLPPGLFWAINKCSHELCTSLH